MLFSAMKIRKGDQILVIRGKDKGKKGKVLRSFPKDFKILVEGVNVKKKHQRPKREGEKGQIIEISTPMPVAKVKLVCPKCGKATRVGYKIVNGKKIRICKKCGKEIS